MDKADKLFYLLTESLTKTLHKISEDTKICVPISGGLDSRVLIGMLGGIADLAFTIDYGDQRNVDYAMAIAYSAGIRDIEIVKMTRKDVRKDRDIIATLPNSQENMKSGNWTALRLLNEKINLKEYAVLVPYDLDVWTGVKVNPLTIFTYYNLDIDQKLRSRTVNKPQLRHVWGKWFKDALNPFDDKELIQYCLELPWYERFHQRVYRRMINEYFPKLASIPRENLHVAPNVNEVRYFWAKVKKQLTA